MLKKPILVTILVLIILLQPTVVLANTNNNAADIYRLVNPSVLTVEVYDRYGNPYGTASAFVIDYEGHAVTNYHVVEDASFMKVKRASGETYNVTKIKYSNKERDIAIFKLDGGNYPPPVSFGSSDNIVNGQRVFAIGNPLGLGNTISEGIISGMNRYLFGQVFLQFTTPISPGSSGGVLINEQGQVIGVTTATMLEGQNINFAIPINDLLKVLHNSENSITLKPYQKNVMSLHYSGEFYSFNYQSNWRVSWNGCPVLTNSDNQLSTIAIKKSLVDDEKDFAHYLKKLKGDVKDMGNFSDYEVIISNKPLSINGLDFYQITVTDKSYFGYYVKSEYRLAYQNGMIIEFCYSASEALFEQDLAAFEKILSSFVLKDVSEAA